MKALYLVDFSNWVYKFKYVYDLSHTLPSGECVNTSVLYGFYSALRQNRYEDIIIALDGCPLLSQQVLPQYKQQRIHSNSDKVYVSKGEIIQFLTAVGAPLGKRIRVVGAYGQEADQVIASIAYFARGQVTTSPFSLEQKPLKDDPYLGKYIGPTSPLNLDSDYERVFIGSTDSDIYALTSIPGVYMDQSWNGTRIDYSGATPKAVAGMPPHLIPIYKAFCGDTSDNVPAIVDSKHLKYVRTAITQYLITREAFLDFCTKLRLNIPLPNELSQLAAYVKEGRGPAELRRNFTVVELTFKGLGEMLYFPTYNIKETFEKYNIAI